MILAITSLSKLDIRQSTDYSPFGVTLEDRNFTLAGAEKSRFGFQNQEMDDEIKGPGNSVNYTYRMHDPRLGRFFAIDPLANDYPWYTPYSFSGNKVIAFKELEGAEESPATNQVVYILPQIYNITDGGVLNQLTSGQLYLNKHHLNWAGKKAFEHSYYDGTKTMGPDPIIMNWEFFTLKKDVREIQGSEDRKDYPGQSTAIEGRRRKDGGYDRRNKLSGKLISNNVPTTGSKGMGYLGLAMAVGEIVYNISESSSVDNSNQTINYQTNIALEALHDFEYAIRKGWVPQEYIEPYQMAVITNVLMSGKMSKYDQRVIFRHGDLKDLRSFDFSKTVKFAKELSTKLALDSINIYSNQVERLTKEYGPNKPQ